MNGMWERRKGGRREEGQEGVRSPFQIIRIMEILLGIFHLSWVKHSRTHPADWILACCTQHQLVHAFWVLIFKIIPDVFVFISVTTFFLRDYYHFYVVKYRSTFSCIIRIVRSTVLLSLYSFVYFISWLYVVWLFLLSWVSHRLAVFPILTRLRDGPPGLSPAVVDSKVATLGWTVPKLIMIIIEYYLRIAWLACYFLRHLYLNLTYGK